MRYKEDRSLTPKETIDYFSGFLNCLLIDSCLEEDRDFLFDLIVENDLFRFQWSFLEHSKTYKATEEAHGFPIEVVNDELEWKDGWFEVNYKDTKNIARQMINTINELSELEIL